MRGQLDSGRYNRASAGAVWQVTCNQDSDGGDTTTAANPDETSVWWKETLARRKSKGLGEDRSLRPWTTRLNVMRRGLPQQIKDPNFQDELLDIRVGEYLVKKSLPMDAFLPRSFTTCMRTSCVRQLTDGRFTMLAASVPYWHPRDRVLVPAEVMLHMGFGLECMYRELHVPLTELEQYGFMNSLSDSRRKKPVAQPLAHDEQAPAKKKRKSAKPRAVSTPFPYKAKLADLLGNGHDLGDAMSVMYPIFLALNNGLWERDLDVDARDLLTPKQRIFFEVTFDKSVTPRDLDQRWKSGVSVELHHLIEES